MNPDTEIETTLFFFNDPRAAPSRHVDAWNFTGNRIQVDDLIIRATRR